MKHVTKQLEQVRRQGRVMLWLQPIFEFIAALIVVAMVLGLLDYFLHLPGWLRLGLGVASLGVISLWLGRRLTYVSGFWPDLTTLALRAERLFPQLKGELATGVEFSSQPDAYRDSPRMAALASRAAEDADQRAQGVPIKQMINPKLTLQYVGAGLLAIAVMGSVAAADWQDFKVSGHRWLLPLGSAQWPKTTSLRNLTTVRFLPADAAVSLRAMVDHGYKPNMRIEVVYRFTDAQGNVGPLETGIMNDQSGIADQTGQKVLDGTFERLIDPPANRGGGAAGAGKIEFYYRSLDDQTSETSVALVVRPAVRNITAHLTPPDYAKGLVGEQEVNMTRQPGQVAMASALTGSTVHLQIELNKPIPAENASLGGMLPGFAGLPVVKIDLGNLGSSTAVIGVDLRLDKMVETTVNLVDENGLKSLSPQSYRFDAILDKGPTAALTLPTTDQSVLPTAVVPIGARAVSEVGVESLIVKSHKNGDEAAPAKVKEVDGHQATLEIKDYALDLAGYELKPGEDLVLTPWAQDVYRLDYLAPPLDRHPLTPGASRTLHIIDEATMIPQILAALHEIVPPVTHQDARQQENMKQPVGDPEVQNDITQKLSTQNDLVQKLMDRVASNKLKDPQTRQTLQDVKQLMDQAQNASKEAVQDLQDARQSKPQSPEQNAKAAEAKSKMQDADLAMEKVVDKLNQDQDVEKVRKELNDLINEHQKAMDKTAKAAMDTLGKPKESLTPQEQKTNEEIAKEEKNLASKVDDLVKKMDQMAQESKNSPSPEQQANSKAMEKASEIAKKEDVKDKMDKASQDMKENKPASAGDKQDDAQKSLSKMKSEMDKASQIQQEMLKRKLMKLADALKKLIEQQQYQLATLKDAKDMLALIDPQSLLRRNTMAVGSDMKEAREGAAAAGDVEQAVVSQAGAIAGMRDKAQAPTEKGETDAVKNLEAALAKITKEAQKIDNNSNEADNDAKQKAYEALVAREKKLRDQTNDSVKKSGSNELTRKETQDYAGEQSAIRLEADKLGATVSDFAVFKQMHQWVDDQLTSVEDRLHAGTADQDLISDQTQIAAAFQQMADAFKDAKKDQDEWAKQAPPPSDGGGGGNPPPPPKVPPTAQLKLLLAMQKTIYEQTNQLDKRLAGKLPEGQLKRSLMGLSTQERTLADLGVELLKQAQRNSKPDAGKEVE